MQQLREIDLIVLAVYLIGVVGLGCWLSRMSRSTEQYMAANRSLPAWAVGLSIFGSYISSISFLANPGKSIAGNWNFFVFSLATPIAAIIAVKYFVPFYRHAGLVSAYEHLESRFGPWARSYAVLCYLLTQMARTGTIIYLLTLAVAPLLPWFDGWGWKLETIIIVTGALMTLYTMMGGMEAVIWVGVVNSIVLLAGPLICLIALLRAMPEGMGQIFQVASVHDKFSLGSFSGNVGVSTFWVVLIYGLVINLGNFSVDQGYVQRYITARSDRAAAQSVLLGAFLYMPVAAVFFFIGTGLFALYTVRPELLPPTLEMGKNPDAVFPWFIVHELPAGLAGLVIAAIFAAAMDPSLNSMATLTLCDIYKRYFRSRAGEVESMWVLRLSTLGWGAVSTLVALKMITAKNVLDVWWNLAGIFSGGLLGLFLLGRMSRRVGNVAAIVGIFSGLLVIVWMTISPTEWWPQPLDSWSSPFHSLLITVVGTATVLLVGGLVSLVGRKVKTPSE